MAPRAGVRARKTTGRPAGDGRVLQAIRAGFAAQARSSGQNLTSIDRTGDVLDRMGHRFADRCTVVGDLSATVDRLAHRTAGWLERLNEAVAGLTRSMEEEGRRIEGNNRHIEENTHLIAESNRRMEEINRRSEEQGVRLEAIGRRIGENTAAVRENTAAILRLAEAIRRPPGDSQPGGGA